MDRVVLKGQRSLLRARLKFSPKFEGTFSGWAFNYCVSNEWRVLPDMAIDDMMGEARLVFWQCARSYPEVTNPAHFFALFRTSFVNRINRYAERRQYKIGIPETDLNPERSVLENMPGRSTSQADADFRLLCAEAPEKVQKLLSILLPEGEGECPEARLELLASRASVIDGRIVRPSRKESANERLCRIINEDPEKLDLVTMVLQWLNPTLTV